MEPLASGAEFIISDYASWETFTTQIGDVIEVDLLTSSLAAPEEEWGAFIVTRVDLVSDGTLVLAVRLLGSTAPGITAQLTEKMGLGGGYLHLCRTDPCLGVEDEHVGFLHVNHLRRWSFSDFSAACDYLTAAQRKAAENLHKEAIGDVPEAAPKRQARRPAKPKDPKAPKKTPKAAPKGRGDPLSQLVRNKAVPEWMVGIFNSARQQSRFWWHVYLDNFALGQVVGADDETAAGYQAHALAEQAWTEAGVLSSAKKRREGVSSVLELGAFIDGDGKYIGGSPERFLKLAHATCWLLEQPLLSKRLVQVVAGRWVHVMQFRRPTMGFLDKTWEFIGRKLWKHGIRQEVRNELFQCMLCIPLMHTHLGATIKEVITASDASSVGGAVGVANTLTEQGKDYVQSSLINQQQPKQIPVMVISLFGGIGGAFRTYDILGVQPVALVHFDLHRPANRIVSRRWPHCEIFGDVKTFTRELYQDLLARHLNISEVHVWAGFPCTDLSAAKAFGEGLAGPASSLFFEVKRIRKIVVEESGGHITCKFTVENVASMKREECDTISRHLGLQPYFLDCADAVPMHRPRLCWTTEVLENTCDDVFIYPEQRWRRVEAKADYPEKESWIDPGVTWPGGERGNILPTAMKAIVRVRPPIRPAGIEKCDQATLQRYQADSFRFPPYQYKEGYIFYTAHGSWRTISSEEKELLLGYGWKHTALCSSASEIKQSYQAYEDTRQSLLGDSFSIFSFVIPAAAMCRQFLPRLSYRWLCKRMGMAPGFCANLRLACPLQRCLVYGTSGHGGDVTLTSLNKLLLSRTNHTGSDVRITTGQVLNPKAHPRQEVESNWFQWQPCFQVKWKLKEHINILELRSIFLAVQYHVSHLQSSGCRIVHLSDSYVCISIASKGRSASKQLMKTLRKLNAFLLAHGIMLILAHVESTSNPTDGASRQVAVRRQTQPG